MSARADRISRDVGDGALLLYGCPVATCSLHNTIDPQDPDAPLFIDNLPDPYPNPEQAALAAERRSELNRALRRLPVRERYIILRRVHEDVTLEVVGRSMGLCRERVRQLQKQALNRLRGVVRR